MKKLLLLAVCMGPFEECKAGWLPDFIADFFWNKKDSVIYKYTKNEKKLSKNRGNETHTTTTYFKLEKYINKVPSKTRRLMGNGFKDEIDISQDNDKLFINNYSSNYFCKKDLGNWLQAVKINSTNISDLKPTKKTLSQGENAIEELTAIETSLNKTRTIGALIGVFVVGYLTSSYLSNSKKNINI